MIQAVECTQERCVALLLLDKVELDSVDKDGNTSLHIAAADGSSKIAKMLCQAGASLTIKNRVWAVSLKKLPKKRKNYKNYIIIFTIIRLSFEYLQWGTADEEIKNPLRSKGRCSGGTAVQERTHIANMHTHTSQTNKQINTQTNKTNTHTYTHTEAHVCWLNVKLMICLSTC